MRVFNKELQFLNGFSKLQCEDCESEEDLHEHRTNGRVKCTTCLNDKLIAAGKEDEEHDDYRDQNYNELITERNL